jgi:hypothetical protein
VEFESKDHLLLSPPITLAGLGGEESYVSFSLQDAFQQRSVQLAETAIYDDLTNFIKVAIQHEFSKEGASAQATELAYRVALLEKKIEKLRMPEVRYVRVTQDIAWEPLAWHPFPERVETVNVISISKFPRAVIVFYSLGLICTLAFAVLITLSALGTNLVHPFLSLLGLVGGLGWLTTAWSDLLLWKRERCLDPTTSTTEANTTTGIAA